MNRVRGERGAVLVIVATVLPVLLLLSALVVDVGNWYTHKRQLQTRADAGATAAGAVYQKQWAACVSGDTSARDAIVVAAHQYAGNPRAYPASGTPVYNPATTPPVNTEITTQPRLNVVLNSDVYDAGTDNSAGGDPCTLHPADSISAAGYWTDVKVKEVNVPSLFGSFGLPLSEVGAQARVAIRPKIQYGVLPIALETPTVAKAQARIFNGCTDPNETGTPLAIVNLTELKKSDQTTLGTTLWGSLDSNKAPLAFNLNMPVGLTGCPAAQDYVPLHVQIRVAGLPNIDLNQTCDALNALINADCFKDLTEIRAYPNTSGQITNRPLVNDVAFSGSGLNPCTYDVYYARLKGAPDCGSTAFVNMDWGTRPGLPGTFTAKLDVGGTQYDLAPTGTAGDWVASGVVLNSLGAKSVKVVWNWTDTDTTHTWQNQSCKDKGNNPCDQQGTFAVHQVRLGDDPPGGSAPTAGIVDLVRVTNGSNLTSQLASVPAAGGSISPYFFLGLGTGLVTNKHYVLRTGNQNSGLITCDPDYDQPGQLLVAFTGGCKPGYSANDFTDPNWWPCPAKVNFMAGPPYANAPWRCIAALPGGQGPKVADGARVATGNCAALNGAGTQCQTESCTNPNNYDPTLTPPFLNDKDPRLVRIFVVPYGTLRKSATGQPSYPVIDVAEMYITAWEAALSCNASPADLALLDGGEIGGYFVKQVGLNDGPVDIKASCDPIKLQECSTVLER